MEQIHFDQFQQNTWCNYVTQSLFVDIGMSLIVVIGYILFIHIYMKHILIQHAYWK